MAWQGKLVRVDEYRWEIPMGSKPGMRVPGLIYADDRMLPIIKEEQALEQVANVAFLPGIVRYSLAMPDIHWGYGFPIGGVAATRASDGVVSPGGVGFDINCGTRLLRTDLTERDVRPLLGRLVDELFANIPSGVGAEGKLRLREREIDDVLRKGAAWAVAHGYGDASDLECIEEGGVIASADPALVSDKAKKRGAPQLGTLGAGNHFIEVQVVDEVFDARAARVMGIDEPGQVLVLLHSGSRGLGHQVCEDYLRVMGEATGRYGIELPDRQLACAPVRSTEGRDYLAAMACAANYAFANRQCMAHWVRQAFERILSQSWTSLGMRVVYDLSHNIAKIERHVVDGKKVELCVHRKGATRAFPPGHPDVPQRYRDIGQPVLIPGDMGRASYVALGTQRAMEETWASTAHGAGRVLSRGAARRMQKGADVQRSLAARGILVKTAHVGGLAEEASEAYKDVTEVVNVAHGAGISLKASRQRPIGVIKG